ncbi:hypothetical protein ACOSP7_003308 [Xanthoceras sorbifolium]
MWHRRRRQSILASRTSSLVTPIPVLASLEKDNPLTGIGGGKMWICPPSTMLTSGNANIARVDRSNQSTSVF